jgi:hypothetical protein
MRRNIILVTAAILGCGVVYGFADRLEVARAVLPPRISKIQLLRYAIHPPFQIATPNTSLIRKIRISLVPGVQACAEPNCDGTKAAASCNDACGYCGHCPDCVKGPCTIRDVHHWITQAGLPGKLQYFPLSTLWFCQYSSLYISATMRSLQ